jgi:predicted transcriptional regulator
MLDILSQLKDKKKQIDELKQKKTRLDGSQDQLLKDLKTKFGLSTVEEAENKLEELKKELERKNDELVNLNCEMDKIISFAQKKE